MKNSFNSIYTILFWGTLLFATSCNSHSHKNQSEGSSVEATGEQASHQFIFACPMHPDVKGKDGDKCSKCGMALERIDEAAAKGNYQMILHTTDLEANKPVTLSFTPNNKDNPHAAVPLDVEHEKKIHLMVVSEDLSWFNHIHPEYQADGSYIVTETFPRGGKYFLFTDYKPSGGTHQIEKIEITVQGKSVPPVTYTESKLTSKADGYEVKFVNGENLVAGNESHLIINIEQNGKLIDPTELEKYLGANAHIVLISQDDKEYFHVHPESNEFPIHAHTTLQKPGIYRMWMQFQTKGKVHTADFVLKVAAGSNATAENQEHHHSHGEHKH